MNQILENFKKPSFLGIILGSFGLLFLIQKTAGPGPQRPLLQLAIFYLAAWAVFFVWSNRSRKRKVMSFVLANLTALFGIAVFETLALVGLVDYRLIFSTPIFSPRRSPLYRQDPELIFVRHPHQHVKGETRGGMMTWLYDIPSPELYRYDQQYDRNGFRNKTDLSTADIAVIGDSMVDGMFVSDPLLMTTLLAHLQGKVVANLGQIGYGPQQELVAFKRYALPLNPRIVIWAFCEANDLKNVNDYEEFIREGKVESRFRSILDRSFSLNGLQLLTRILGSSKPSGLPRSGLFKTSDHQSVRMFFLFRGLLPDHSSETFAITQRCIADAYKLCASRSIRMIVVFIPTKFRVYKNFCHYDSNSEVPSWVLNDMPQKFRDLVSGISDQIGYIDLTPNLVESASKGTLSYFTDDEHWAPDGHRIAAEVLHKFISGSKAFQDNTRTVP